MSEPDRYLSKIRAAHRRVVAANQQAAEARDERDRLIVELYATHGWSYARIAAGVEGISTARVQQIIERNHRGR